MKNEMDKTITFSIREEERDRERKMLLRTVYDALSEKGYNPINQLVGYVLTEDPTYITNYKNARGLCRSFRNTARCRSCLSRCQTRRL